MSWTPRQRALIRLDRLARRPISTEARRRVRAARSRVLAGMAGHEVDQAHSVIYSERSNGRHVVKL